MPGGRYGRCSKVLPTLIELVSSRSASGDPWLRGTSTVGARSTMRILLWSAAMCCDSAAPTAAMPPHTASPRMPSHR